MYKHITPGLVGLRRSEGPRDRGDAREAAGPARARVCVIGTYCYYNYIYIYIYINIYTYTHAHPRGGCPTRWP